MTTWPYAEGYFIFLPEAIRKLEKSRGQILVMQYRIFALMIQA